MPYSTEADIKVGNIPLPPYLDKARLLQDATDEIDSYIGFIYQTPVNMAENGPVSRPARLLIKRISNALVTGRLVLEVAAAGEDTRLHAYGQRMVDEALASLKQIASREVILEGVTPIGGESSDDVVRAPLIYNEDPRSQVEAFYNNFHPTTHLFPGVTSG